MIYRSIDALRAYHDAATVGTIPQPYLREIGGS
jgi:hypothetical protein